MPCVSEICGSAGGLFSGSPFAGAELALAQGPWGSFTFDSIAQNYPDIWNALFPGVDPGQFSGIVEGVDQSIADYSQYLNELIFQSLGGPVAVAP